MLNDRNAITAINIFFIKQEYYGLLGNRSNITVKTNHAMLLAIRRQEQVDECRHIRNRDVSVLIHIGIHFIEVLQAAT